MLLPGWALVAEPEDLLGASQSNIVGEVPLQWITYMVPFRQDRFARNILTLCKVWVLDLLFAHGVFVTLWAAMLKFADPVTGCLTPLVVTDITEPVN